MNGTATRFLRLAVSLAGLVTLGWVLTGQAARPVHHGIPTDWSHHHLVFSRPSSPERAAQVSQDPRYWQQMYRRQQRLVLPAAAEAETANEFRYPIGSPVRGAKAKVKPFHRDWAEDTGPGASVGGGIYPAKFSFDIHTAFCNAATTPDYVVYGTGLPGSTTQATVVAYDNLYNGCSGTSPMVYWAYNTDTGTQVLTSPVLSLDGSQVAFVQTTGGSGFLVTLKWKKGDGHVGTPSTPTVVPSMSSCSIAPCMTRTPLRDGGGVAVDDQTSSVYYDYSNDVAWVGGALGWLHKITGVFNGTPTEVTSGFPVQVSSTATWISSPVYDHVSNNVFVGDDQGFLYSVNATSGTTAVASGKLDFGTGLVDGPIIDSSNGFVYVFASSDGSATCTAGVACSAVYQLSTTFAATTTGFETTIGDSVVLGGTPNPAYIGGFDSSYFDSVSPNAATGNLYVCGSTGTVPTLYQVPIATGVMPVAGFSVTPLATTGSTAGCSPVTDLANPNLPGGAAERLFLSAQNNGAGSGCAGGGCAFTFVDTPWQPFTSYALGQQVLSSKLRIETVITAGTSAGIAPNWSTQAGATDPDGNPGTQVVWIDQGLFSSPFSTWIALHPFIVPRIKILDGNGNVEVLTTPGTTGSAQPTWNMTYGGTTTDGTGGTAAVWTNAGPYGSASLAAAGGTGGIIVDNTLGPFTVPGGSDVYYGTLAQGCGVGLTDGCAVQATQLALQ